MNVFIAPANVKKRGIGVFQLLTISALGCVSTFCVIAAILSVLLLSRHLEGFSQLLHRDTAGFVSNSFVEVLAQLRDTKSALTQSADTLDSILPGAALVLTDADGTVLSSAGHCRLETSRVAPFPIAALTAAAQPTFPLSLPCPCREHLELLSSSLVRVKGHLNFLLIYMEPQYSQFLYSPNGIRMAFRYFWPAIVLEILGVFIALLVLRLVFLRGAIAMLAEIRRYAAGERGIRLQTSSFDDLNQISETFNKLADEESAKLAETVRHDENRKRALRSLIHDLKTPLAAIEAAAERLLRPGEDELVKRYREIIRSALHSQDDYGKMLEQLASLQSEDVPIVFEQVQLEALLEDVCRQARSIAESKELELVFTSPGESVGTLGNGPLLRRAFQNVLSNGIRYSSPGGRIVASIQRTGSEIELTISDTGIGIEASALPYVTREFFRAETASGIEGSGLGLAIVNEIITLHGGRLVIESVENEGTSVRLFLPGEARPRQERIAECSADQQAPHISTLSFSSIFVAAATVFACCASGTSMLLFSQSNGKQFVAAGFLVWVSFLFASRKGFSFATESMFAVLAWVVANGFAVLETNRIAAAFSGFAVAATTLHLNIRLFRERRVAYALAAVLATVFLSVFLVAKQFYIGLLGGSLLLTLCLVFDLSPGKRPVAWVTTRAMIACGLAATLVSAISAFFFFLGVVHRSADHASSNVMSQPLLREALNTGSREHVEKALAELYALNPLFDVLLFDDSGLQITSSDMAVAGTISLPPPDESRVAESAGLKVSKREIWSGGELGHPFSWQSRVTLWSERFGAGTVRFAVQSPSALAEHLVGRKIDYFIVELLAWLFVLTMPPLLLIMTLVSREISFRLTRIKEGLHRYQSEQYDVPIELATNDFLGEISGEIDILAAKIPVLHQEARQRAKELRVFLGRCGFDLRAAVTQMSQAFSSNELTLSNVARKQRHGVENLLELFRLESEPRRAEFEIVPFSEVLAEECFHAEEMAKSAKRPLRIAMSSEPSIIRGDAQICVSALRHFFELAVREGKGGEVQIILEGSPETPELAIFIPGLVLNADELQFLESPIQSVFGLDGSLLPLGGYSTALIRRQFESLGWSISFSSQSGASTMIRLRFRSEDGRGQQCKNT